MLRLSAFETDLLSYRKVFTHRPYITTDTRIATAFEQGSERNRAERKLFGNMSSQPGSEESNMAAMFGKQSESAMSPVSAELVQGISAFTVDLYKLVTGSDDNVFMSPYSVAAALLLVALGAGGDTERQIRQALGVANVAKEDVNNDYRKLQDDLNLQTQEKTTLAIANRMFARLRLDVGKRYNENSQVFYNSGLELMDFVSEPEKSRIAINKWVAVETRNKIRNLIPEGRIDNVTMVVLINAIYFKGDWLKPFEKGMTRKAEFRSRRRVMVDMMNATLYAKYIEDDQLACSAVQLPYSSGDIAMVIILPVDDDGLADLEDKLNSENIQRLCKELNRGGKPLVILRIPKFRMEASYELTRFLPELGIVDLFSESKANLSEMLPSEKDVYVSDVIHNAFIEVNEEGTEATAATAFSMGCQSKSIPQPPSKFIADHPFMFLIRDNSTGSIVFIGRYMHPSK